MMQPDAALTVERLSVRFGDQPVFRDLSFSVPRGTEKERSRKTG